MANILIKNVPTATYSILQQRARDNGQSLEEFILELLVKLAEMPTDRELTERLRQDMDASRSASELAAPQDGVVDDQ